MFGFSREIPRNYSGTSEINSNFSCRETKKKRVEGDMQKSGKSVLAKIKKIVVKKA